MITPQEIATALYQQVGSPIRGGGPCLTHCHRIENLWVQLIRLAQQKQRQGELLSLPAEAMARQLLAEVVMPGAGREPAVDEVVI